MHPRIEELLLDNIEKVTFRQSPNRTNRHYVPRLQKRIDEKLMEGRKRPCAHSDGFQLCGPTKFETFQTSLEVNVGPGRVMEALSVAAFAKPSPQKSFIVYRLN